MPEEYHDSEVLPHHKIPYNRCPKYECHALTLEQVEEITDLAAKKAVELAKTEAYMVTGTFVITKAGYLIGFLLTGIALYLLKIGVIDIK
jgi:hypothetical protein